MFSGKMWRMISVMVCLWVGSSSRCSTCGNTIPTPALEKLIAARPIKRASVVTTSKYKMLFQPMRPTCLMLLCPAMPYTKVPKRRGAIMHLIKRRNNCESTLRFWEKRGKSIPISTPITILIRMVVVSERLRKPYAISEAMASQRATIKTLSGTFTMPSNVARETMLASNTATIATANIFLLFMV